VIAPEWAAQNRRELTGTKPDWVVDGLGPLNKRLAITEYSDLREWLGNYQEVSRTKLSIIYKRR
jgi:hypothetical protein